jgi:hypothetical protein
MILVGLPIFAFWEKKKKKKKGKGKGKGKNKKRLQTVLLLPSAHARKTSSFTHPKTTGMASTKDLKSKGEKKKKKVGQEGVYFTKKGDWQASIPIAKWACQGLDLHTQGHTFCLHGVGGGFFSLSLSFL